MKILNNPIDILFSVFEKEYPNETKKINRIVFGKVDNGFGATIFNNAGADIVISPTLRNGEDIPLTVATELLAHELAHIIAGYEEGHGEVWGKHFERLFELYSIEAEKKRVEVIYER